MTIALRGHHLLCMLTYIGRGYTEGFTRNYDEIAGRISSGETLLIVQGADDICLPLLCEAGAHCHSRSVLRRDERALELVSDVLARKIGIGSRLNPDAQMLERLRAAFADGRMRKACFGCEWAGLCRSIAKDDFQNVKIACPL